MRKDWLCNIEWDGLRTTAVRHENGTIIIIIIIIIITQ